MSTKKVYFASDFHLGSPDYESSLLREKKIVRWLDQIKVDASEIYFMGDIFDFWFEYKNAVPKGFTRILGKIAELSDSGIKIYLFQGNHDMWIFNYLPQELGLELHRKPVIKKIGNKTFYLAHGDGLGPGDHGYKFIKAIFANRLCQWLFARLHPNFGIGLAYFWSRKSRKSQKETIFLGEEKEWLVIHSKQVLENEPIDYFIYGHRHTAVEFPLSEKSTYFNLGDWINHFSYAVFDGNELKLEYFEK